MEPYIASQFQSQPSNSGLLRFRSAPSSLLSSFRGGSDKRFNFNQSPPVDSSKSHPRFLSTTTNGGADHDPSSTSFEAVETKPFRVSPDGYSVFGSNHQLPPPYPKSGLGMEVSFRVEDSSSVAMDQSTHQAKGVGGGGGGSNVTRQSSSPAGFFAHLNAPHGYDMMRGGAIGNFTLGSATNGEQSSPRSSRMKGHMGFAAPGLSSSSLGHLPRIPEIGAENSKESSPDDGGHSDRYRNGDQDDDATRFYGVGFSFASWNDSSSIPENSSDFKAHQQQNDRLLYSGSEASPSQGGGILNRTHTLSHHLSLPKTSAEVAAVEKLLTFQDTVPCKIRAKRGCATHPRSIAERVRRTRISERMRKLQELVPNMDKQINTADMLDFAVDYIKDLQKQYKMLSDSRARCRCLNSIQSAPNQAAG